MDYFLDLCQIEIEKEEQKEEPLTDVVRDMFFDDSENKGHFQAKVWKAHLYQKAKIDQLNIKFKALQNLNCKLQVGINALIKKQKPNMIPQDVDNRVTLAENNLQALDETEAVKQPVNSHFVCPICMKIVIDPLQCGKCEKLVCTSCMNKWKSQSHKNDCVHCRTKFVPNRLNKFVKESLFKIELKCNACKQVKPYKEALFHLPACQKRKLECIQCLQHGKEDYKFETNHELRSHIIENCPYTRFTCKDCDCENTRRKHDCISYLKEELDYHIGSMSQEERERYYEIARQYFIEREEYSDTDSEELGVLDLD